MDYDERGNVIFDNLYHDSGDSISAHYNYGWLNRLDKITFPEVYWDSVASEWVEGFVEFYYNQNGDRIKKYSAPNGVGQGDYTKKYHRALGKVLMETTSNSSDTVKYIYAGDDRIAIIWVLVR